MKQFILVPVEGGVPVIDFEETPYHGYVLCDVKDGMGAYMFSGSPTQLLAIRNLPDTIQLVWWNETEDGKNKEVALSRPLAGNVRIALNAWLTDMGEDTIPAQNEGRGVLMSVYGFFNEHFNIDNFDVVGTDD